MTKTNAIRLIGIAGALLGPGSPRLREAVRGAEALRIKEAVPLLIG